MEAKHSEQATLAQVHGPKIKDENSRRQARRALLRLGAGATPALLMLPSAPVSAGQVCVLASSYVSPNTFASVTAGLHTMQCTYTPNLVQTYMNEAYTHLSALSSPAATPLPPPFDERISARMGTLGADPPGVPGYTTNMTLAQALYNGGSIDSTSVQSLLQHLAALSLAFTRNNTRTVAFPYSGTFDSAYIAGVWQNVASNGYNSFTGGGLNWPRSNVIAWARVSMGLTGYFV